MLALVRERKSAQPIRVELANPGIIDVHNHEFAADIARGYSRDFLEKVVLKLIEENALELPVNSQGVIVAAPRGVYSKKAWDRDHLRDAAAVRSLG